MNTLGTPSTFTCPTCRGTLWELHDGQLVRYRCYTGHAFSIDSLALEQSDAVEEALYSALGVMEEKSAFLRRMAHQYGDLLPKEAARYAAEAETQDERAQVLRELLAKPERLLDKASGQ